MASFVASKVSVCPNISKSKNEHFYWLYVYLSKYLELNKFWSNRLCSSSSIILHGSSHQIFPSTCFQSQSQIEFWIFDALVCKFPRLWRDQLTGEWRVQPPRPPSSSAPSAAWGARAPASPWPRPSLRPPLPPCLSPAPLFASDNGC